MASKKIVAAVLALCVAAGLGYVYVSDRQAAGDALKIYGSVDMRTVDLAFEESGRIGQVSVEEGDTVKVGDVLAKLDDERYAIALENARATLQVRQKELDLLLAGSRVEEIDAARATYKANAVSADLAQRICEREQKLGQATTEQMVDQACSQARVSRAQALAAKKNLDLLLAGTRVEQIDVARANVALARTGLDDAARALRNCELKAPSDGVVRSRLKEKGDMVSASAPVYEIALMDPMWVRAWIDEVNLGKISVGQRVKVYSDSYPREPFDGTVGFVSTVAEFTPKTVQTEALRTALVYEVRVTVQDPDHRLRLGMPATVQLSE